METQLLKKISHPEKKMKSKCLICRISEDDLSCLDSLATILETNRSEVLRAAIKITLLEVTKDQPE